MSTCTFCIGCTCQLVPFVMGAHVNLYLLLCSGSVKSSANLFFSLPQQMFGLNCLVNNMHRSINNNFEFKKKCEYVLIHQF